MGTMYSDYHESPHGDGEVMCKVCGRKTGHECGCRLDGATKGDLLVFIDELLKKAERHEKAESGR